MAKTLDPDERRQLRREAKKLQRKEMSYREIGETLGVSNTTVCELLTGKVSVRVKAWKEAHPERLREYEQKRNRYKREWESGECEQCGGVISDFRRAELCRDCRLHEYEREFKAKAVRYIELRKEGLLNGEIEERESLPRSAVAAHLSRAKHNYGMDVPRSPYFKAPA